MTNPNPSYQQLSEQGHRKVKVAVTDVDGILRGKYIHIDKFKSSLAKGLGFCNVVFGWDSADVCYDNVSYTGWHSGYPDAQVRLDPASLRYIPWDNDTPFMLGDFQSEDSTPLAVCPRQTLKRIDKALNQRGFRGRVGVELEWFNFRETPQSLNAKKFNDLTPLSPGMYGYSILRSSLNSEYFNSLLKQLDAFKVPLEGLHTETGPGVLEAAIMACDPVEAGDRGTLFKSATKEIGAKLGILASFMARWNKSLPGCGGHLHISLCDAAGDSAFYDASSPDNMSACFRSFLAGLIEYLPELLPMLAPTVNSYKRLVPGYWAPTSMTWGIDNRTVALRVLNASPESSRVEIRVGGADMNPYLAIAAALGAGLMGIEQNKVLSQAALSGNAYEDTQAPRLASNLKEAAKRFKASEIAKELFSKSFVEHFADSRLWEWECSQQAITDWELQRYFEVI